jgi:hypothetical protein
VKSVLSFLKAEWKVSDTGSAHSEEISLSDTRCLIQDVVSPHLRNFHSIVAGNIETMFLKLKYDGEFAINTMNEWSLNSRFVYVAY